MLMRDRRPRCRQRWRWLWGLTVLLIVAPAVLTPGGAPKTAVAEGRGLAVVLDIKGPIGPATSDYVVRGLDEAAERGARLVILRMDTPGGLDTSMRAIIRAIVSSPVPVASYVAPSGARAASAGTYIAYASHVAAMAPGTNLGAATPVKLGGAPTPLPGPQKPSDETDKETPAKDEDKAPAGDSEAKEGDEAPQPTPGGEKDAMTAKVVNDAVAYIRSLAEMRGRNAEWAEKAVREAASLPASEAAAKSVVDFVATDLADVLAQASGRTVKVAGEERTLATADLAIDVLKPDWQTKFLSVITNPNVAFILMLVGIYGLIFEMASPGAIFPGTIGAISLIIALYALHVLPVNYAGGALLLLGIALTVAEAFLPSFGILGIGGIASFLLGALLLFDTDVPGLGLSWPVIVTATTLSGALFLIVLTMVVRAHRRPVRSGREDMVGSTGRVTSWSGKTGWVSRRGENWRAEGPSGLRRGQTVKVVAMRGLTLVVESD